MNTYNRMLLFLRPYMKRLLIGILCMMVAAACYVVVPWILKSVIDKVLINKDKMTLNLISFAILVIFFIRGVAVYGQNYSMQYVGQKVVIDIREALYRHLQRLSISFFDKRKTGVLMSNVTNDVGALQAAIVDNLVIAISESVILVGSLVSMLLLNWKLTLLTLIIVPLVLTIIGVFGKLLRSAGHEVQGRIADITALLQETIAGIRIIKSFAREAYEMERFKRQNHKNFNAVMKATKLTALLAPIVEFAASVAVTVIIWYGGYTVINGIMTSGALIAFLIYAINLTNPVKRLSNVYGNIQKSMAAADRIFMIIDTPIEVEEKPGAKVLPPVTGFVECKDVTFSYDQQKVALNNVTFIARPGQTIALVGPSGAGKSTIANLIPRFYDVTEGSIAIDGIDIRDVTFKSLREQIGVVPQDTVLFNATIRENILYGRLDATDEEVYAAAKAANALEFIEAMPQGFDTLVGDRGNSLSGGQRQRISIARAILKNPRILVLDEATSALDTESEMLVQDALERLMQGRTAFVIAHRLSTIRNADLIYVLQDGHIVEEGTHMELLKKNGLYAYLYSVQFNETDEQGETVVQKSSGEEPKGELGVNPL